MMNGMFAGKAMGIKHNFPTEEELQQEMMQEQQQAAKKRSLFGSSTGTFDTSKILGSGKGKVSNIDHILGKSKKKTNFDINKFLNTGGKSKFNIMGDNMTKNKVNYNDKLKQFGIIQKTTKNNNMAQKLKQFGLGMPTQSKNIDPMSKLKQFGIGKTVKTKVPKLKNFGLGKTRTDLGIMKKTLGSFNVNTDMKIREFTGMGLKKGVRGVQRRATVKGIGNTEAFGWNRINQQKGLKPLGDFDGDRLVNMLDCNPRNPNKQGPAHEGGNVGDVFPIATLPEKDQKVTIVNQDETPVGQFNVWNNKVEPVEAEYTNVTPTTEPEEKTDAVIDIGEIGEKIKKGLGAGIKKTGEGLGTAAKYVGGAIADKYRSGVEEARSEIARKKEIKIKDLEEEKDWERIATRKAREEALKEKYKEDVKDKIKNPDKVKRELQKQIDKLNKGLSRVDKYDKYGRKQIDEFGRTMKKSAYSSEGAMGIPIKEPSKIGQLIGGSRSGRGIVEMAGQSGRIPFSEKVSDVAGLSRSAPFALKVADVTGKTGYEPTKPFSLKVLDYVGSKKDKSKLLEEEESIYEKLKEQAQAKREWQQELAAQTPIIQPTVQQPTVQQPTVQQPTTPPPVVQQRTPAQQGKVWSERSKRWVSYPRGSYDKNKQERYQQ